MAQLPTFTANLSGNPINSGRAASADDFGAAIGDAGKGLTDFVLGLQRDAEDDESRKALIGSTKVRAEIAAELDDAVRTGADTEAIREKMHDKLAQIGTGFQTKRGAEQLEFYTANSDISFQQQANSIRMTRAAVNARLSAQSYLTDVARLIERDPNQVHLAVEGADALADSFRGASAEERATIKQGLRDSVNMIAAMSAIQQDPKAGLEALNAGQWQLKPEQVEHAKNFARTRTNELYADEARKRDTETYERRKRDSEAQNSHIDKIIKGTAKDGDISADVNLEPDTKRTLISFKAAYASRLVTGEKRDNQRVMDSLYARIGNPNATNPIYNEAEIMQQFTAGNLTISGANFLRNQVRLMKDDMGRGLGTRLESQVTTVRRALQADYQFLGDGELQSAILNDYRQRVTQLAETLRDDPQGPNQMFDARSKHYIGDPKFIAESVRNARADRTAQRAASVPKVNVPSDALGIPDGTVFTDPNGVQRTMTPALRKALQQQGVKPPPSTNEQAAKKFGEG